MPIAVRCACGKEYHFKDEYAGRRAKCPACGQVVRIPGARPPGTPMPRRPSREASPEGEQSRTVVLAALGFAGFVILVGIGLVVYFLFFSGPAPRAPRPAAPSPATQQPSAAASQGPAPASGPPAPAPAPNPAPAAPETPPAASPPAPVVAAMPGQPPKPVHPQQSTQPASITVPPSAAVAKATPAKDTQAAVDTQDLARDLNAVMENAGDPRAIDHAMKLGITGTNFEIYTFLATCGKFFIHDDQGNFNSNADRDAFAAAVLSITPEMIQRARELAKGTDGDSVRGAVFILLSASGRYVQQPGKFQADAFNKALQNLDASKVDRATELTATTRDFALTMLLRLSGGFLDATGAFDRASFNGRLAALKPAEFSGNEEQRTASFLERMKVITPQGR